jgi:hypothetical protein
VRSLRLAGFKLLYHCNDPKPICQEHHGFGVFKNFSGCGILSNTLLIYLFRCVYLQDVLLISALGFTDVLYMCCNNKQEDINILEN